MSAPMKKPITGDFVEVRFRIPVTKVEEAKKALASYGALETSESVPWREVYPNFNAGLALRAARKKAALTQKGLAELLGINQTHISEMEGGKRPIGKEMAKRLAKVLKIDYRLLL